ncbi:hypothetical protein [Aurantimonas sp. A2-1-M11]|uniref:hypothetical protein n=1 Tax=Aurantimonas sp. A2-1-M11 TaxID=3113712 RepID=UPI002F9269B3
MTGGELDWSAFPLAARSQIVVQNQSIELVMVLDNSGSMGSKPKSGGGKRKINTIKEAATNLTAQFLKGAASSTLELPVQFGVVPFAAAVNVGPDNASAAWMDTKGRSSIHNEYLDWANWKSSSGARLAERSATDDYWQEISSKTPLTRFFVYKNGVHRDELGPWKGCVESRPGGLAITDAEPAYLAPDTLFVPTFAPDEYDGSNGDNDYFMDGGTSRISADAAMTAQSQIAKYFGASSPRGKGEGPNRGCRTTPITPLTDVKATVDAAINAMTAAGETNIPEGIAWGWRVLSAREPFSQGRAEDAKDNLKVLVLMTDGDNNYGGNKNDYNESGYGTFGYASTYDAYGNHRWGRIFDDTTGKTNKKARASSFVTAMNEKVAAICQNIKDDGRKVTGEDGIVIFTIAFDLEDGSSVKKLLEQCASYGIIDPTKKLYYDAKSSSDLLAAFDAITEQVSSLRIAK